jgi:hypothetical protein
VRGRSCATFSAQWVKVTRRVVSKNLITADPGREHAGQRRHQFLTGLTDS